MKKELEIVFKNNEEMLLLDLNVEKSIDELIEVFSGELNGEGFKQGKEPKSVIFIFQPEANLGILKLPNLEKISLFDILLDKENEIKKLTFGELIIHFANKPQIAFMNDERGTLIISAWA